MQGIVDHSQERGEQKLMEAKKMVRSVGSFSKKSIRLLGRGTRLVVSFSKSIGKEFMEGWNGPKVEVPKEEAPPQVHVATPPFPKEDTK